MPIDYKKYPSNWLKEIRPRILKRANNTCECEGCDFKHLEEVWAVRYRGRTTGWFRDFKEANSQPKTIEGKVGKIIPNPKKVKVILTIAHLDHDETNHNITDDRLKAMCQLCHLRYDAREKYRRSLARATTETNSSASKKICMQKITFLIVLLPLFASSQPFSEFHIGATSRMGITGYGNVGHFNENSAGNGYLIAATGGFEHGFGFNAGGYAGWQWPGIAFYGGATYFAATNKKLAEGSRPYPLAGVQLKWDNRTLDFRYMGDAVHVAFGVRF